MNLVVGYFYGDKKMHVLKSGTKRDMIEYMESFCLDYVAKIQGYKVNKIDEILKPNGEMLSKKEWDNNLRLWVNRSKNLSKYTIKQMTKKVGYFYNSYEIDKLVSVYLVEDKPVKVLTRKNSTEFDWYDEFNEVINVIGSPKNEE